MLEVSIPAHWGELWGVQPVPRFSSRPACAVPPTRHPCASTVCQELLRALLKTHKPAPKRNRTRSNLLLSGPAYQLKERAFPILLRPSTLLQGFELFPRRDFSPSLSRNSPGVGRSAPCLHAAVIPLHILPIPPAVDAGKELRFDAAQLPHLSIPPPAIASSLRAS